MDHKAERPLLGFIVDLLSCPCVGLSPESMSVGQGQLPIGQSLCRAHLPMGCTGSQVWPLSGQCLVSYEGYISMEQLAHRG